MQNPYRRAAARSKISFSWTWIAAVWVVIWLIVLKWMFWWSEDRTSASWYLLITPTQTGGSVTISMSASSKNEITHSDKLYTTDKSVVVSSGASALAENDSMKIDIDGNTELSYISAIPSENAIGVSKWRAWINATQWSVTVQLKNFSIKMQSGDILLVEQNYAYSTAYAIRGTLSLSTTIWSYSLEAGNRIMIWASDLTGNVQIASLAGAVDESIMQSVLFQRNNWFTYLSQINPVSMLSGSSSSGSILSSGSLNTTHRFIEITDPIDGTIAKTTTITVMGKILSKEVKRVTINDKDTSVSPVNESFILQNILVDKDILNLVFKAYDSNNSLLEKWVIVVFATKWAKDTQGRLVSNNFPISNKDFKITFPGENPYKTTDSVVKVQWTVPKDTVSYIVVNDYRLQKFTPNSTTWYYYANTDTKSMVDGINLYTIKFYGPDNSLLYSQLFTIVKEPKNATVSGEFIR